jgi:CTP synthase (UTP-ammonia lyase)
MSKTINIGIIGDYDAEKPSHAATINAIDHAARHLAIKTRVIWLPTPSFLSKVGQNKIKEFDALWGSPGSPYRSMEGALIAIRLARESKRPFIGT